MENSEMKKNYFRYLRIFFLILIILVFFIFLIIKTTLEEKIETVKLESPNDCEKEFPQWDDYKHCLTIFAGVKKDPSICDRMVKPGFRPVDDLSECKASVAINTGDITFCEKLKEFDERDECFLYFAISAEDPKLCSRLYHSYCYFNQCLYSTAVKTGEIKLCEVMRKEKEEDFCYKNYHDKCLNNIPKEPIPYLGVHYILIDKVLKVWRGLSVDYGALIEKFPPSGEAAITPGSPADKAGLKEGDIILEIDGIKINETNDLSRLISAAHVGDKVTLKVLRDEKEEYKEVILEEKPKKSLRVEWEEILFSKTFKIDEFCPSGRYKYEIKYPERWNWTGGYTEYCPTPSEPHRKWCLKMEFYNLDHPEQKFYVYNPLSYAPSAKSGMQLVKTEVLPIQNSNYTLKKLFYISEKEKMIRVEWKTKVTGISGAMILFYESESDEHLKIFNQMLSTFRFLE
jgi:hypothetical protein